MREDETVQKIEQLVYERLLIAGVELPEDVHAALRSAAAGAEDSVILQAILKNLEIAEQTRLPMCQDTGMAVVFLGIGEELSVCLGDIRRAVDRGIARAYTDGSFRKSVVEESVFQRTNTGNNLPAVYHVEIVAGDHLSVDILMKGFGSENCSSLRMLNPTAGEDGVVDAVVSIMRAAGGKPCPPVVLGVGIGGTSDRAAVLSKKALLREVGSTHRDSRYAALEQRILEAVQALGIGPGGFGGEPTALGVMIEQEATHIAGLPVAVSINCWADRKVHIELDREGREL